MKNFIFYLLTVLIWGSTWIGIKLQLGVVDPVVSVAYRFALAAILLFCWCLVIRKKLRFSLKQHGYMALQGLLLFGFNYLFFYLAELHIASGLAAVLFSTILIMNVANSAIFLGKPMEAKVAIAGLFGMTGIVLVFRPEITAFSIENNGLRGVLLCLFATLLASLGNIVSAYNQKVHRLPVMESNAWGMCYGAMFMLITAAAAGKSFTFDPTPAYVFSLLYLAVFGSIVAFGCYLALVGSIGADRAAYATLLFPIVALLISTAFEGYRWTLSTSVGVLLILAGNIVMIRKKSIFSRHGLPGLITPLLKPVRALIPRRSSHNPR